MFVIFLFLLLFVSCGVFVTSSLVFFSFFFRFLNSRALPVVVSFFSAAFTSFCFYRKESGLPFFDILLITGLPKSASLPVATTQQTKLRLQTGKWNFSYVFFSESDQIFISRELQLMYNHLKKYPG
jgi:hypothetical protein